MQIICISLETGNNVSHSHALCTGWMFLSKKNPTNSIKAAKTKSKKLNKTYVNHTIAYLNKAFSKQNFNGFLQ